jgi:hypothetical protein
MGGFAQISAGSVGSGAANAGYITRPAAAEEEDELYHNAPKDVEEAETWEDTRIRLRSWAEQVEAEEKARHGNRVGQPRTHYRGILSYEDKIETEAARADAQEFLEKEFPDAQAVAVVHQDTEHTHVHIWMSARKLDGKKVHIDNQDIKDLHETFDEIYERRMQVPSRNAEKVEETRQFKREYAKRWHQAHEKTGQLFREGVDTGKRLRVWRKFKKWKERNRPDRADPPGPEVYRKREERQYGKEIGDEVEARAEARADEQRAEEISEQKEVIEDLRQRHEQRERNRHGSRHEGGASRDQRGADRDAPAARPGERRADGAGEKHDHRHDQAGTEEASERAETPERQDRGRSGGDERRSHGFEDPDRVQDRDGGTSERDSRVGGSVGERSGDQAEGGDADRGGNDGVRSGDEVPSEVGEESVGDVERPPWRVVADKLWEAHKSGFDRGRHLDEAREAYESLSEEGQETLRERMNERGRSVLSEAIERGQEQDRDQSTDKGQDESRDQGSDDDKDRGQSRGYERGIGF